MGSATNTLLCGLGTVAFVGMVSACAGSPAVLFLDGDWHLEESFEDDIHLVSCSGVGSMTVTQQLDGGPGNGPSGPGTAFSAVAGVDTGCTSLDGPFNYFGNGDFAKGLITAGDVNRIVWNGTVNDAVCQYQGVVTGHRGIGLEMSGTLNCTLEDPGVTFNFVGIWQAWSSNSAWCMSRSEQPGCLGSTQ